MKPMLLYQWVQISHWQTELYGWCQAVKSTWTIKNAPLEKVRKDLQNLENSNMKNLF